MSEVVMPQMGESIAEGTIVRWIKKVGDRVDRDEPLFEISTDKVDAEIPSPVGRRARRDPGEGRRDRAGELASSRSSARPGRQVRGAAPAAAAPAASRRAASPGARGGSSRASRCPAAAAPAPAPVAARQLAAAARSAADADSRRQKSSPLVRKIAKEHSVDLARDCRAQASAAA